MGVMAKWSSKTWEVSSRRIAALNSITAGVELDTENNHDKAGSPATLTKALKLQTMTFDFDLAAVAGSDVLEEYNSWISLIGQISPFYLAGKRFGPANLLLTAVNLSDTLLDSSGKIQKGKITINLAEYAEEASSKKASTGGSKKSGASGISGNTGGVGPRLSAVEVGASANDKAAKKPGNTQLNK